LARDQQQGRKGNREHRGCQLAGIIHGYFVPQQPLASTSAQGPCSLPA